MQIHTPTLLKLITCSALLGTSNTWAQTSPYYVGITQSFSHESNLFRLAEGLPQTSDVLSSTGLVAGFDQPIGRQRVYASGNVRNNRYRDTSRLDNTSYGLIAGLDWSTAGGIAGTLVYGNTKNLASYGEETSTQFTGKNIQTTETLSATVRKGVASRITLRAGFDHTSIDYSAIEFSNLSYRQDVINVGMQYQVSGLLTVGGGVRYTEGEYPQFGATATTQAVGDSVTRKDLDLNATWTPTGLSTVNARLSYGRLTRKEASAGSFSGATGSLSWAYTPTGKLSFNTSLTRDNGTESRIASGTTLAGTPTTAVADSSRLTTSLQFQANYAFSAKIGFTASAAHTRRSLVDALSMGTTGLPREGSDKTTNLSLGARYMPTRYGTLACGLARESRTASNSLSYAYSANTANCSAQLTLQ